jgi:hypothetical protein
LSVGSADRGTSSTDNYYSNTTAGFMYNNIESRDLEKLYALMKTSKRTEFENYLVNFNSIKINQVTDFAGTVYLREYKYAKAIEWFKKEKGAERNMIYTDPFIELLYDQVEWLPKEKDSISKLDFAKEMLRLERLTQTDKKDAAKHFYKMALGMYNMTYYGHAWPLVQYDRSGSEERLSNNVFQKEYYGCFTAHNYFEKALEASTDKDFKAKCLFMMAKCSQKQVVFPSYNDFPDRYDQYEAAAKKATSEFVSNKYFDRFVKEYKGTKFYEEAFNSCSYLRDFVGGK